MVDEARSLVTQGDFGTAAGLFEKAAEIEKTNPDYYFSAGVCYVRAGDQSRGIAFLKSACELNPDEPNVVFAYADALVDAGQVDDGLEILESMRSKFPDFYLASSLQGATYLELGQF